jgi:VWFA-related protein
MLRLRLNIVLWTVVAVSRWGTAQTVPALSNARGQKQAPPPQSASVNKETGAYSLQVKSQLVTLDVVVTDKKGAAVLGLTRDDFNVFENKVQQPIVSLEEVRSSGPAAVAIHSTAELDRLEPLAPVSILVLDEVTSKFEDEAFARYALKKYLASEGDVLAQPTMLIAVSLDHQMLLHDYTTSKKEVLDALDGHFAGADWRATNHNYQGQQVTATLLSLTGVAVATAGHEGHKNIVWIGRGFPSFEWDRLPPATAEQFKQAIATCTNRLRDARATLYSVDPAGVTAGPPMTHGDPDALDNAGLSEIQDPFGWQVDFDAMARATGGMALHGTNDVNRLIEDSVNYGKKFYTIAYKPTAPGNDSRAFPSIQVVTTNRRLAVTAREGYFTGISTAAPAMDAQGKVPTQVEHDLAVAADGLMVYDGVPLTIERVRDKSDGFRVSFPASAIAWIPDGTQETSDIVFLVSSYDKKGRLLHRDGHVIGFTRQSLAEDQIEDRVLHVLATIATATPAARVRVIVRANGSGKIGAGNYFLSEGNEAQYPSLR